MSGGVSGDALEKLGYDQRTLDQAVSREHRGMGLQSLLHSCIQAAGLCYPGGRADNGLIQTAFEASKMLRSRGIRASGFSSVDLPGILSNVANKSLLNAYRRIESVAMRIAHIASANDFKEMAHYQFEMDGMLSVVPDGGEIPHVSLAETPYTNKLATRGAMVALTRQMIINDDLEAFLQIPNEFGRKAAQTLENAFFTSLFDAAPTLFTAASGNKVTDVLSPSGLDKATQLFGEQRDINGGFILVDPKFLVVPPALSGTAKRLWASEYVNETTAAGKPSPSANVWEGMYEPLVSPYIGGNAGLGGSNTNWFLCADPLDVAFMEIAFLKGVQVPTIESAEMDFNTLGMQWRCYFDFGVAPLSGKGAIHSDGTN